MTKQQLLMIGLSVVKILDEVLYTTIKHSFITSFLVEQVICKII